MPHLFVEYSAGTAERVDIKALCEKFHDVLVASPIFPTAGIRVKAYEADIAIIGDGLAENNFVTISLAVGEGRTVEELKSAGDHLFKVAQQKLAELLAEPYFSLSFEIREINSQLSWKDTPIHQRLSGSK